MNICTTQSHGYMQKKGYNPRQQHNNKQLFVLWPPLFPFRTVICLAEASCRTSVANRRTYKIPLLHIQYTLQGPFD